MSSKTSGSKKVFREDSSGGFLSVDREKALQENWSEILAMKRPATVPASSEEGKTGSSQTQDKSAQKKSAKAR